MPSIYWTTSLLSANAITFLLTIKLIRMLEQAKTTLGWASTSAVCARLRNKRVLCYKGWCYYSVQCRRGIYTDVTEREMQKGWVGGCGTHAQRHKLQSNSGLLIHSPLEKEPLTAFENSCQATWERKDTHRIVFFCTKQGMNSKNISKGRGKEHPRNAKQKTLTEQHGQVCVW